MKYSAKYLEPLKSNKDGIHIEVHRRSKNDEENATIWENVLSKMQQAGVSISRKFHVSSYRTLRNGLARFRKRHRLERLQRSGPRLTKRPKKKMASRK